MICPECKKNQTSVVSSKHDKDTNTIKRGRKCECGYKFVTYEISKSELKYKTSDILKSSKIIIKKKRKIRNDTLWQNIRFIIYARYRMKAATEAMPEIIKNPEVEKLMNLDTAKMTAFKIKGKSYWELNEPGIKSSLRKIERKKETINRIVKMENYWKMRNHYLEDKPIEDMRNKDKIRKEAQQFFKSVCTYITDSPYNQDFFIKYTLTDKEKIIWKKKEIWDIWKLVR
jgi:transcriptional regulator NrdR family protein